MFKWVLFEQFYIKLMPLTLIIVNNSKLSSFRQSNLNSVHLCEHIIMSSQWLFSKGIFYIYFLHSKGLYPHRQLFLLFSKSTIYKLSFGTLFVTLATLKVKLAGFEHWRYGREKKDKVWFFKLTTQISSHLQSLNQTFIHSFITIITDIDPSDRYLLLLIRIPLVSVAIC